ncbi:MAG: AAA family ATPase [Eubacteriales bacterium]|nr:AAA family ATPase [Eubacteriales bacterium]
MEQKHLTVLEQLSRDCRNAYFAGIPIIYVRTYETELMHQLVSLDEIVQRRMRSKSGGLVDYDDSQTKALPWNYSEGLENRSLPGKNSLSPDETNPLEFLKWDCSHLTLARGEELDIRDLRLSQNQKNLERLESYVRAYAAAPEGSILRRSAVILYSEKNYIPEFLQQYTEYIDVKLPREEEIRSIIEEEFQESPLLQSLLIDDSLFTDFCGLNRTEVYRMVRRIKFMDDSELASGNAVKKKLFQVKEQVIKRNEILELLDTENVRTQIGGLRGLKEYVEEIDFAMKEERWRRETFGTEIPKGILLCGIPGCGKSLAARFAAKKLRLPLLKLDVGMLMGKYQGESEHNMQKALEIAEAMAPCILFIDELDKAFSGSKNGNENDSGSFKRMFSRLLGWMQDKTKPCFIFATANDLTGLPSEFFRSGRFDRLYAMYLPTEEECIEILRVRLEEKEKNAKKRKQLFLQDWHKNTRDLRELVELFAGTDTQGQTRIVTGADIEKLVNEALAAIATDRGRNSRESVTKWEMKEKIEEILKKTNVYGDGKENRIQIAKTYIQLLNLGFVSTTGQAIYSGYDYDRDSKKTVLHKGKIENMGNYDTAVERLLTPLMESMIPEFEEEMFRAYLRRSR